MIRQSHDRSRTVHRECRPDDALFNYRLLTVPTPLGATPVVAIQPCCHPPRLTGLRISSRLVDQFDVPLASSHNLPALRSFSRSSMSSNLVPQAAPSGHLVSDEPCTDLTATSSRRQLRGAGKTCSRPPRRGRKEGEVQVRFN
jgi:hypothetical protein